MKCAAETLIGATVFSPEGDKVGTVKDILFDTNGKATGLVLSVGGILGLGAKSVGLTWDEVDVPAGAEAAAGEVHRRSAGSRADLQDPGSAAGGGRSTAGAVADSRPPVHRRRRRPPERIDWLLAFLQRSSPGDRLAGVFRLARSVRALPGTETVTVVPLIGAAADGDLAVMLPRPVSCVMASPRPVPP